MYARTKGGVVKPVICSILAMIIIAATQGRSSATQTDSLYCDGRIVSIGDTAGEVMSKCGPPAYSLQREEESLDRVYRGSRIITTSIVDDWTFNFGPDRFQYRVLFRNGTVWQIESLDYGY